MVYQFPLAPLVLHTFHTANAGVLADWAAELETPYPSATFFNFIASHDGIGVRPAEGLLSSSDMDGLVERTRKHDGQVSYKTNKDGSRSVYELNITLYDALNDPNNPDETIDVRRFLASQVIMLSLAGVPGIYVHSLFGSRNCHACLEQTGRARSINREKFQRSEIESQLGDPTSITNRVFYGYTHLLRLRKEHPAFHPNAGQKIHQLDDSIFSLTRTSLDGRESILCLVNVTPEMQSLDVALDEIGLPRAKQLGDLISGELAQIKDGMLRLELDPYQSSWFTERN
jgi:sucrose phosphorylase